MVSRWKICGNRQPLGKRGSAAWERQHQTFRMTEVGFPISTCSNWPPASSQPDGAERVSDYNTGLFYLPGGAGLGFTPLIDGVSRPYLMDRDGRRKRPITEQGAVSPMACASPMANTLPTTKTTSCMWPVPMAAICAVDSGNPFNLLPNGPCGQWILFLSGEHYDCHPYLVRPDGSGLVKLADRGGYRGVVEPLKFPDFHSASSDLPVWATDGQAIYFTAQRGASIELFRVRLDATVEQLSHSAPGVRHYHPKPSPDDRWLLFGSDSGGNATASGASMVPIDVL